MARFATGFAACIASMLASATFVVGACSSFDGETPTDAGTADGGASEGGGTLDGGTDGAGESGPSSFCATQDVLFCDDFDQPGRVIAPGAAGAAPWDLLTTTGLPLGSLATGPDNSRALRLKGNVSAANTFLLREPVDLTPNQKTRVRFDDLVIERY